MNSVEGLPHVNSNGQINFPYIETTLLNIPQDERIIGWRTSIVERTEFDRSVVTQGLFNAGIDDNFNPSIDAFPSYIQRTVRYNYSRPQGNSSLNKPVQQNASLGTSNLSANLPYVES
jgi:hypothetical protein